jgi:hypothetical protein
MSQIIIGNKNQKEDGSFELEVTFILDIPQVQQVSLGRGLKGGMVSINADDPVVSTVTQTMNIFYDNGTAIEDIQADLVNRLNSAQDDLNNSDKLSFYGMTFDGSNWS